MNFYLLGQKIRLLRITHHLSQANLAELIDVSTNYIGQIERGDRKPSLETLVDICNVLHTNMDFLLSDSLNLNNDQLSMELLGLMNELSAEEKNFFYNTISNYIQMKKSPPSFSSDSNNIC